MQKPNQKKADRLIYTGAITTILPFAYGISLLNVQVLESKLITDTYRLTLNDFFQTTFFILFVAAGISNFILYSFPKGVLATFLFFISSAISSILAKKYYVSSILAIFYSDCILAVSCASIVFATMVYLATRVSKPLETRMALSIGSICFCLGFGFFNIKENLLCMLFSRVYIGFAAGCIAKYLPCYLSLIAPIEQRGIFSSLYSLALIGGLLVYNAFQPFFKTFFNTPSWSIPVMFFFYPAMLFFCTSLQTTDSFENTLYSLIVHPNALKSLLFVSAFHMATNLSGINQLALCPQSIYGDDYNFQAAMNLLVGLGVSFFNGYLFDKFGRKIITIISCSIIMVGCIAFYFRLYVIFTAYLFSFGFNLGMSSIPYVILGEIFPKEFISVGSYFGTQFNWIGSAASTIIPQGDVSAAYNPAFLVYFVSTLCFTLGIFFFFKETKGRTPCFQ